MRRLAARFTSPRTLSATCILKRNSKWLWKGVENLVNLHAPNMVQWEFRAIGSLIMVSMMAQFGASFDMKQRIDFHLPAKARGRGWAML
jgi:hypothetical protein